MSNKTTLNAALAAALLALGLGGTALAGEDHAKAAAQLTTAAPHEREDEATHEQHEHMGKAESRNESQEEEDDEASDDDREDAKEGEHHD